MKHAKVFKNDTIELTQALAKEWRPPPFQRPLRPNAKVLALIETIKQDGIIPGVVSLGTLKGATYLIDGQHRIHAFLASGIASAYVDVRVHEFENMGDMGEEFVNLNSRLVHLRPDDILRGLEPSNAHLARIRRECSFVGYDMVRRGGKSPFLSMSLLLRSCHASTKDTPASGGTAASAMVSHLTENDAAFAIECCKMFDEAWGRDPHCTRLWNALNMTMVMWIYRRMVMKEGFTPDMKRTTVSKSAFARSLFALSANDVYMDWLQSRGLTDRDRKPCYDKIKALIGRRLSQDIGSAVKFPQPEWAN